MGPHGNHILSFFVCPASLFKGIVAAVRSVGGRFLDLDERTGIYEDIGDKKATEKTSQALREGQTQIRKKIYTDECAAAAFVGSAHGGGKPSSNDGSPPAHFQNVISSEGYFGFSVQVLETLYKAEENESAMYNEYEKDTTSVAATTLDSSSAHGNSVAMAKLFGQFQSQRTAAASSSKHVTSIAVARALEQFPGAASQAQQDAPTQREQRPMSSSQHYFTNAETARGRSVLDPSPQAPIGHYSNMSSIGIYEAGIDRGGGEHRPSIEDGRLTNMTLTSMFSINSLRQLLESAQQGESYQPSNRGTIESVLSAEIRDLIQMSKPQLDLVGNLAMDDMDVLVDKEVDRFHKDTMDDRVSDLRFTDMSRWSSDSTESTNHSKNSSMDASTRSSENMSIHTCPSCNKRSRSSMRHCPLSEMKDGGDIASAELLLQLSVDHSGRQQLA
jgi:hypothetical protein